MLLKCIEFKAYADTSQVHITRDTKSGVGKGIAYVQYEHNDGAEAARLALDKRSFQGRLLHILPAEAKRQQGLDEHALSQLPLKKQREIRRKIDGSTSFRRNPWFMSSDAAIRAAADRLGVSKSEIFDPTSSDAAVKQAQAETSIRNATKDYLKQKGINLESTGKSGNSDTIILVKNFPFGTSPNEIKLHFEPRGNVVKMVMPPTGIIAILQMENVAQAQAAFKALAYSKFKDSILYLEMAPKDVFRDGHVDPMEGTSILADMATQKLSAADLLTANESGNVINPAVLYVGNLNFTTTTDRLRSIFKSLDGFVKAIVSTKADPKKPGQVLSMGFGFVEFKSRAQAQSAMAALNGLVLDKHSIRIKQSQRTSDAAEDRRIQDQQKKIAGRRTKIIIKNLPFEVSRKDVRALFQPYGEMKSIRLPKKFDSSTRGFAFVEFTTAREAENAIKALRDTHLLGRRLVLDFAAAESMDAEEEIERMHQKVGQQTDKVALQKLTSIGRKKFRAYDNEDDG